MRTLQKNLAKAAAWLAIAALVAGAGTSTASATEWTASAGAQSPDQGSQALAFLANELWIHAGDSIRWTFRTGEMHTVTFLKPGQTRPSLKSAAGDFIGCPNSTPDGSSFDGSTCVTSAPATTDQTYSVNFPSAGNFKLVCLVHLRMTGAIHVLDPLAELPHDQDFYDRQADLERRKLLSDDSGPARRHGSEIEPWLTHEVTAGVSVIVANGGGSETAAVMRFLGATTVVHVGDTVEWTNLSTPVFHTITFGTEPANLTPPSSGVTLDPDGVRHGVVGSTTDSVNSGFIGAPGQETIGQPQTPLDFTRFRVTFTAPGTFSYICGLHDTLGMTGTVIVRQ
ncbi:MAG TPA: plastocyanin/azurin family copper-binding protein [Bryobacteraceae bacterium]|jgi:plastocyanin|nr:plastocyanin/azurin family copper-binding protein [Bryobacteraceae bacterium]